MGRQRDRVAHCCVVNAAEWKRHSAPVTAGRAFSPLVTFLQVLLRPLNVGFVAGWQPMAQESSQRLEQ